MEEVAVRDMTMDTVMAMREMIMGIVTITETKGTVMNTDMITKMKNMITVTITEPKKTMSQRKQETSTWMLPSSMPLETCS